MRWCGQGAHLKQCIHPSKIELGVAKLHYRPRMSELLCVGLLDQEVYWQLLARPFFFVLSPPYIPVPGNLLLQNPLFSGTSKQLCSMLRSSDAVLLGKSRGVATQIKVKWCAKKLVRRSICLASKKVELLETMLKGPRDREEDNTTNTQHQSN